MHYQLTNQRWAIACILNFSFQETFPQNPKSIFKILCSERTYLSLIGSFQESCILNFSFQENFSQNPTKSIFKILFPESKKVCTISWPIRMKQFHPLFKNHVYWLFLFDKTFFRIQPSPFSKYFSISRKKVRTYPAHRWLVDFQNQVYWLFLFLGKLPQNPTKSIFKILSQNPKKCALSVDQSAMSHSLYT